MSNVIVDRQKIDILANAISTKSGVPLTMTLDEMVEAVDGIEAGGGEPNLQAKTYTVDSAGTATVTADSGYDGLSSVAVSVPSAELFSVGLYKEDYEHMNMSVNNDGRVMASYYEVIYDALSPVSEAGYADTNMKTGYYISIGGELQLSTQSATVITPTKSSQTAVTAGKYTTGAITVNAIPSQYIIPTGNKSITNNGTNIDVAQYSTVSVNVPTGSTINNQNKTVTPSETQQSVSADSGYTGLGTVTVGAISSTYVGSGITRRSSTDLTASGATVTVPSGYYSAAASKTIDNAELVFNIITSNTPTIGNTSGTLTLFVSEANIITDSSSSSGYISVSSNLNTTIGTTGVYLYSNIPYNQNNSALTVSGATVTVPAGYYANQVTKSVASGSATAPASISGTAASVSTGTNTLTLTKTVSVTPTVTAGYVSSGTAGNSSVSLTASVTTKAAATITPTTTNQTIAAGTYLTGTQTIAGDADLVGGNILSTANIFGVQGTVDFIDVYIRSAAPTSSVGNDGDIYIQE